MKTKDIKSFIDTCNELISGEDGYPNAEVTVILNNGKEITQKARDFVWFKYEDGDTILGYNTGIVLCQIDIDSICALKLNTRP